MIYSQEKYICSQVKDIENELNYDYYYFGNNKRKHLFEYNIIKNNEENIGFSIYFKKIFFIINIFVLIIFGLNLYKTKVLEKINKNDFMNETKSKLPPLQNNLINNEAHVDVKLENQKGSPKSKSISNLSTCCSIDLENKHNNNINPKSSSILINFKFTNKQKNTSSGKKRDHSKGQARNSSLHSKRRSSKLNSYIKILIKDLKKLTKKEGEELKDLFATYISDINKNTSDSNLNLNSNSNLIDNNDIYKKIFSLIKSEDTSSSEDIDINEQSQGNSTGELENNFLFSFDNGRLLKLYKDFQFIGKGGFGVVFKATQKIDESQCAIKVMKINLDIKEDKEKEDLKVTQEIKSMLKFKKKNIVRYKTCWFEFKQKKAKKKRERAMSLEQRYTPGIDFNDDFIKKGKKRIKNRLKKYLKTSLERIQSISKEIKLAEKQNNAQKNRKRKSSIWDDNEESDSDSLGANKNYAIKEEGEDTYINLEDNESSIEEVNENMNDENEDNSNSNSGSENESSNSESDNSNNINEFKVKESIKEEKKNFNENQDDSEQKDKVENFQNKIKELECNSNFNIKLKNINNCKDFSSDINEDNNEDEYNNLITKKNLIKTDLNNESSSKNTNSKDNNFILVGRDSENNSIFDEEIKKEKEELNVEKKTENFETNSNEESESDEDEDEDEDDDDLKNNSDNEGLRPPKKKKNKTYPIYFFIQMEYCSGCPMNYYLSHRTEVPSRRLTTYMLYQMCNAVKHIHEGNIIHRDLKPGNIFIIDDYLIKIGDFGLALNSTVKEYKQGGTYLYQSPEQIKNEPYDEKIDIFALGVILVELVSKFNTEFERRETLQGLKKEIYPEYLKKDHLKEYNLVKKMTRLNPKERPNIKDIFNDNDFNDLITESSA